MSVFTVIMAGGVGSRFYPMSTNKKPKQFLSLFSQKTMIRETFDRVLPIVDQDKILISSNFNFEKLVKESLPEIPNKNLLMEPVGRNTGPALGLAALVALKRDPEALIVSLHSDHYIKKESRFLTVLQNGIRLAKKGRIVTLGITPTYPETGYGYIHRGKVHEGFEFEAFEVKKFVEKPDLDTAKSYLDTGNYAWNAGMFIFKAQQLIDEMSIHCPELHKGLMELNSKIDTPDFDKVYSQLQSIAIDVAVMEKSSQISMIPCDVGWSDVGSFYSLFQVHDGDENKNVKLSKDFSLFVVDSYGNLTSTEDSKSIALVGVSDLMVVDTAECLLVGRLDQAQDVKKILDLKS
ncbi:MAG: mannose-1-phosphate guanylyltransferase [bacterium]|nr:mannose-1-phosphate guanylyltransferase [bacterium]